MAPKPSPNSLIHCAVCGEDYSATYRRCPFCGAKNAPPAAPSRAPAPPPAPEREPDPDDTYVFDGQDLFDDEYEDDYRPARPKGGKRLAEKPSSSPFADAQINWPRLITFLCSLIIIVAALVIVFTVIYPQLRGTNDDPNSTVSGQPSPSLTDPVGTDTQPVGPDVTDPVGDVTDPVSSASDPAFVGPGVDELLSISFRGANDADFTLQPNGSHTITLNFDPSDWSGTVTWSSDNPEWATVDATGKVTNVNTTDKLHMATITVTAGGLSLESKVYCRGVAAQAPSSEPPASDPPATTSQAPSSGGNVTVGRTGTIVGADGGLRVRSGPGTSHEVLASLVNGNTVTVMADAGDGWYQIQFSGSGGSTMTGYIKGEYISTN